MVLGFCGLVCFYIVLVWMIYFACFVVGLVLRCSGFVFADGLVFGWVFWFLLR